MSRVIPRLDFRVVVPRTLRPHRRRRGSADRSGLALEPAVPLRESRSRRSPSCYLLRSQDWPTETPVEIQARSLSRQGGIYTATQDGSNFRCATRTARNRSSSFSNVRRTLPTRPRRVLPFPVLGSSGSFVLWNLEVVIVRLHKSRRVVRAKSLSPLLCTWRPQHEYVVSKCNEVPAPLPC